MEEPTAGRPSFSSTPPQDGARQALLDKKLQSTPTSVGMSDPSNSSHTHDLLVSIEHQVQVVLQTQDNSSIVTSNQVYHNGIASNERSTEGNSSIFI